MLSPDPIIAIITTTPPQVATLHLNPASFYHTLLFLDPCGMYINRRFVDCCRLLSHWILKQLKALIYRFPAHFAGLTSIVSKPWVMIHECSPLLGFFHEAPCPRPWRDVQVYPVVSIS